MSIVRASNFFDPFSREVWDPFSEYSNVSVVSLPRTSIYDQLTVFANPRIDSKETPDALVFKVGLPRLRKNEVKVHIVRDNLLEISGERKVETEEKNDKWRRVERSSGQFVRRFKLPENVKADQVKADLDKGMLTVTVPKKSSSKAIPIF